MLFGRAAWCRPPDKAEERKMFFESMESRSLMSASAFSTQVTIDRLDIRAALLKFRYDAVTASATLIADCSALQAADVKGDAILAPLFTALHREVKAMRHTLDLDRLTESSAVLKDESVVVAEEEKYVSDEGHEAARAADRIQMRKDRVQLEDDEIAGLNSRLATRESEQTALTADLNAITAALGTDTGASTALQAAVTKFVTDRTASLSTFESDLHGIITARTQLVTDLNASLISTST
jgi:hypothetical protein